MFKDPGRHVTGVYVSTPLEAMPPIMIFETKSKVKENMRIKPSWVKDMPKVVTMWGFEEPIQMNTQVGVRTKESMDETPY